MEKMHEGKKYIKEKKSWIKKNEEKMSEEKNTWNKYMKKYIKKIHEKIHEGKIYKKEKKYLPLIMF